MEKNKMNIVRSFKALRGNAKACVWTEWMWAVPNTLYAAYATLYMQELGLSLAEIGLVSSLGLAVQIIASLLSGVIADKMGRRLTTFVFDMISWGIPVFLWSVAQSFEWFVAAAMCNGLWRITGVTFGLLSVEDAPQEELVHIFSLSELMSLFSAFFAPVSKVCVDIWGIVPTMRVIYAIACTLMVTKFILLFFITKETQVGLRRMQETKNTSPFALLWDCRRVFWNLLKSKEMLLTIGILVAYNVVQSLNGSFWSVIVTSRMGVSKANVSLYAMIKQVLQLSIIIFIVPKFSSKKFKNPMLLSWGLFALAQLIIICTPVGLVSAPVLMVFSSALEGIAIACMSPVLESLVYINSDPEERSRILGMVYAIMLLIMTVFPMIAGALSEWDVRAPMFINLVLFAIGSAFTCALWNIRKHDLKGE